MPAAADPVLSEKEPVTWRPDVKVTNVCLPAVLDREYNVAAVICIADPLRLEAAEVIKEVDSSNVKMLFDIYHQQITEGDLIRRIREYIPYIGHFHSAGNPGRNELYDSEIDYKKVFQAIKETGYDGHIGLEYFPREDPAKGLEYAKQVIM